MNRSYWKRIARDTLRGYFAPIIGALRGISEEYRRIDAQSTADRQAECDQRISSPGKLPHA